MLLKKRQKSLDVAEGKVGRSASSKAIRTWGKEARAGTSNTEQWSLASGTVNKKNEIGYGEGESPKTSWILQNQNNGTRGESSR